MTGDKAWWADDSKGEGILKWRSICVAELQADSPHDMLAMLTYEKELAWLLS